MASDLFITVKVMHVCDPAANLYLCQMGSQPAENLFSTLNHNRIFDVLQLRDRLQAIVDIQDISQAHPNWRKRHERYDTDHLTPLQYTGSCSVQSVDLKKVWERGATRATSILQQQPQMGSSARGVLESLFESGATLLKPRGVPLVLDKEMNLSKTHRTPKEKRILTPLMLVPWNRHGSDRNKAYVPCANGSSVHITQLVNEYFNGNVEHVSTDRLRRTANTAQFGHTCTNPDNVAFPNSGNVDGDAIIVGAIVLALMTFLWGQHRTCSVRTFNFSWCTVDVHGYMVPRRRPLRQDMPSLKRVKFCPLL